MLAILIFATAPVVAIMTFIYLNKKIELEPLPLIFRTFILGMVLVFPLMFIQYAFRTEGVLGSPILESIILAGLLEEFFKWFVFIFVVYKHGAFDHHYDGIIYGVAISLGFATVENIIYLFANGIEYAWGRAIFPVSSHALFGLIMGYYIGKAKFKDTNQRWCLFLALFVPVGLHSVFDVILSSGMKQWIYIMIPFMILLWLIGIRKLRIANRHQHFHMKSS
ncbi:glutamic-type intramembrane protease PrsW [Thalassobacillus hwangdonensis]|uniref:Protease PrsW n=1 Tax=Thalassobacillus hwangdonensis TaxID=546108 RepID=A0ABW3KXW5_9BACI